VGKLIGYMMAHPEKFGSREQEAVGSRQGAVCSGQGAVGSGAVGRRQWCRSIVFKKH